MVLSVLGLTTLVLSVVLMLPQLTNLDLVQPLNTTAQVVLTS